MYLAKVTGTVVATQRAEGFGGVTFLLVEATDDSGMAVGKPTVAVDAAQAGVGEFVYVVTGREATLALDDSFVPVDLAVVGHIDDVQIVEGAAKAGETKMTGTKPSGRAAKPKVNPRKKR